MATKKMAKGFGLVSQNSDALAQQSKGVIQREELQRQAEVIRLGRIVLRSADTRPANAGHVLDLCESIAAVGLIEPIVVDMRDRLIAGLHRYQACRLLLTPKGKQQEVWESIGGAITDKIIERLEALPDDVSHRLPSESVPVRKMPFDAMKNPAEAVAAEIAENEKRRDYGPQEVSGLKDRLEAAGYDFKGGRPKRGVKAGVPALETIIGKSRATVHRLLNQSGETVSNETVSPDLALARALKKYLRKDSDGPLDDLVRELLERIENT